MPIRGSPNGAGYLRPQAGRDRPESVVAINRNAWSQSIVTAGRDHPVRACVVADAVGIELVSASEFPANREIYRERLQNGCPACISEVRKSRSNGSLDRAFPTRLNNEFALPSRVMAWDEQGISIGNLIPNQPYKSPPLFRGRVRRPLRSGLQGAWLDDSANHLLTSTWQGDPGSSVSRAV